MGWGYRPDFTVIGLLLPKKLIDLIKMGFSNKDDHQHVADYETDMYTGITTFHGLVRIYNSKQWWSRIFWIVVSFAAMVGFFFQVIFPAKYIEL